MVRKSRGGQKVEMGKMSKESNLQVTFSKRQSGRFKKASELCTLCGAEIAIILFSPGNKVFSFGHPGVESLLDRFVTGNPPQHSGAMELIEAHSNATVLNQLEMERKRGEELNQLRKAGQTQSLWEAPIEDHTMPHLEQLKASLEKLKKNVTKLADKLLIQNSVPPQFLASSSSGGIFRYGGYNPNVTSSHEYNLGYGRGFLISIVRKFEEVPSIA